ncbi:adenylate/guanylate cyclase domain-containing protein [Arthrobacter sp. zg-Y179]|uniref:adenylate/guanylate cyclase domain-containing protein n=1 Tax=Arthrobacter sp. zg-Y179 TaxID=2894188 RepID=UPI001E4B63B4|nr:adenylate/guanylate cyclase domain-containing protein [Arthrobacter sp. zg-Y179]MCC9175849.1 adenylate/guanylate cyclase domain-containing protein [Arthrobacter sp. zg-Y179]
MYPSIESSVSEIFGATWNITNGTKVPKTEDVVMKNGGRLVDATYLYADLAGSSKMADSLFKETTAKIIRAYINSASRILRHQGGEIRSFDGDRVMAIFMGDDKETRAVRAALAINWAVVEVIRPAIERSWSDGKNISKIAHGIGIDTGEALIVRGGVRDNNDLISIGQAPNRAAKLSEKRDTFPLTITGPVFNAMSADVAYTDINVLMWQKQQIRNDIGTLDTLFRSQYSWAI